MPVFIRRELFIHFKMDTNLIKNPGNHFLIWLIQVRSVIRENTGKTYIFFQSRVFAASIEKDFQRECSVAPG